MIVDTSALVAILYAESDADYYAEALAATVSPRISAANWLEAAIVVDCQAGAAAGRQLDALIAHAGIVVAHVTASQVRLARQAYQDFGKGRHPAGLNFGDCFAYALAKEAAEPLLFKGDDFGQTDLRVWQWQTAPG